MTVFDRQMDTDANPLKAIQNIEEYIRYMCDAMQRTIDIQQKEIADLKKKVAEMESANG